MLAIKFSVDQKSLKEAAHILRAIPRAIPYVLRDAIKRTIDMSATDIMRRVADKSTIKKGRLKKDLKITRPTRSRLYGAIGVTYYRHGLISFEGRQTKHGITYRIHRGMGRKLVPHGFILRREKYKQTFVRSRYTEHGYFPMKSDPKREAIVKLKGPSIWWIITDTPGILKAVAETASKRLGKHIDDQIGVKLRNWDNRTKGIRRLK